MMNLHFDLHQIIVYGKFALQIKRPAFGFVRIIINHKQEKKVINIFCTDGDITLL